MDGRLPLPAPTVLEAEDGFIDWEYTGPLTVRVAAYPSMAANDVVTVHWESRAGRHDEPVRVSGAWVGAALSARVPNRCLSSGSNKVSYTVERFAGGVESSRTLLVNDRGR
ncbi:hypothetical protein [Streptomyces sp. N35]|uniref:hypothetical protein n=1 Tax=Streptomyces sp. N35 TaxID=2795730 RepID=UPI0018F3A440|nr:hypothetical protein [Streptomyces sp. N35]